MSRTKGRIERDMLISLISTGLSTREIGKELERGPTSIRYWLRIYGLETKPSYHEQLRTTPVKCVCGETDPLKFYGHKKNVCGACHNQYTLQAGQKKKNRARKYLGNRCCSCGFDKYPSSLAIHHKDPAIKDSKFQGMRGWSWARIERELQSCVLLCHNCHGAYHAGELLIDFDGL